MSLFKNITLDAANTAVTAPIPTNPYALGGDDILNLAKAIDGYPADVPGMQRPFLPHQAASFTCAMGAIARWGCALIGDDMGLGKTQTLLAIIEATRQAKGGGKALIIAPAVTKAGYQGDLKATFPTLRFHHIYGRTADFLNLPDADIYWMTDDTQSLRAWLTTTEHLPNGKNRLVANDFVKSLNILARDEMHRDKGQQGKAKPTSRAGIMQVIGEALRAQGTPMVGMTGTLLTNRPIEGYLPLMALGGKRLLMAVTPGSKSEKTYKSRYCNPTYNGWGWDMTGANKAELPRLHDALCRTVMGRRSKKMLKNLPHSGWLVVPIALNGVLARYNRIVAEFLQMVKDEDGIEAMWRKARAEAITKMSALREEAGIAKAQAAAEYIQDLVDQGRKVVAFYEHTEAHDKVKAALEKMKVTTASINGKVTGDRRTKVINDFQAGNIDVVIGQLGAMGIGVTLTAAADAVFIQTPWSAGDLKQAADRILRCDDISMQRAKDGEAVTWHVLQAAQANGDPTLDMQHFAVLEEKAKVCDAVNAGEEITLPDDAIMKQTLQAWFAAQS